MQYTAFSFYWGFNRLSDRIYGIDEVNRTHGIFSHQGEECSHESNLVLVNKSGVSGSFMGYKYGSVFTFCVEKNMGIIALELREPNKSNDPTCTGKSSYTFLSYLPVTTIHTSVH